MQIHEFAKKITALLPLTTQLTGVKFLDSASQIPADFTRPEQQPDTAAGITVCQALRFSEIEAMKIAVTPVCHICPIGAVVMGHLDADSTYRAGELTSPYLTRSELAAGLEAQKQKRAFPSGPVLYYPLAAASPEPDVIMAHLTIAGARSLSAGWAYSFGQEIIMEKICIRADCDLAVRAYQRGQAMATTVCTGDRFFTGSDGILVALPWKAEHAATLIAGVENYHAHLGQPQLLDQATLCRKSPQMPGKYRKALKRLRDKQQEERPQCN